MTAIWLIIGGARSGKSRLALQLAQEAGLPVTFVATAAAADDEMAMRIEAHRRERPAGWRTIEEPVNLARAIGDATSGCVIVDCLTLWISNRLLALLGAPAVNGAPGVPGPDPRTVDSALTQFSAALAPVLDAARAHDGIVVFVTNEVGSGVVPPTPIGRAYRDALGAANQRLAEIADRVYLCVAGLALELKAQGAAPITRAAPDP